jgi:ATP phosphoribosyltransferase
MKVEIRIMASSQEEIERLADFLKGVEIKPEPTETVEDPAVPQETVEDPTVPQETVEDPTVPQEKESTVTVDEVRALATSLIRANLQPEVKEILNGVGATSISKIPEEKLNEVFASLNSKAKEALK